MKLCASALLSPCPQPDCVRCEVLGESQGWGVGSRVRWDEVSQGVLRDILLGNLKSNQRFYIGWPIHAKMAVSRWLRECPKPSLSFNFLRKCGVEMQKASGNKTHLKRGGFLEKEPTLLKLTDFSSSRS